MMVHTFWTFFHIKARDIIKRIYYKFTQHGIMSIILFMIIKVLNFLIYVETSESILSN